MAIEHASRKFAGQGGKPKRPIRFRPHNKLDNASAEPALAIVEKHW